MKASTSFIAGLAIGAAGGIVAGATYMKRKMDEYIEDQVDEEVRKFVDDYFARKEEEAEESDISEDEDEPDDNPYHTYNSLNENLQKNYHKPDPSKIFRDPLMEHPEEPEDEHDILDENPTRKEKKEDDDMKDPKLISEDKFDEDIEFDKETLYYYQGDDVLTDEDEHEVDNQLELVGDALDKFGFRDNDEQVIHVRNFEKKVDYEVIKAFTSFRD